jgi:hypothetical protein
MRIIRFVMAFGFLKGDGIGKGKGEGKKVETYSTNPNRQQRIRRIDLTSRAIMLLRRLELPHFLIHLPQPIPAIVMPGISPDRAPIRKQRLIELLIRDMLMSLQGKRIRKPRIQLRGAPETLDRLVVLAL